MTFRMMGAALGALALCAAPAAAQQDIAAFEGVWTSRIELGPELGGEIVIARDESDWRAILGGVEARGADFNFVFADDAGRLERRGETVWWIQPPGLP
ncbi:MAG TPA: hypothetical protein VM915_05635, partial [Verrucomicrobiae bacterium]|nr:hypothetical protein [Verrucomicrobiae bacterium]